jgi:hypothetical protein
MKRFRGGAAKGLALVALSLLGSCGQDTGYLYEKNTIQRPAEPGDQPAFDLTESLYSNVTWYQNCDADPMTIPSPTRNQLVLEGAGPHNIYRERMFNVPLIFKGKVCPPRKYERDVVIVVEVAGATNALIDPIANDSCRRYEAFKAIVTSLPAGSKMAVVTSEEVVAAASSQLFDDAEALYADLVGHPRNPNTDKEVAQYLCGALPAGTGGPADFNVAFTKAKQLLETGRANQNKKEIVFMADGFGTTTIPQDTAKQIAQELGTTGVDINGEKIVASIATLHISGGAGSGTSSFVHQFATKDRTGQPLTGDIQQAQAVGAKIGSIAANVIESDKLRIRPIGSTTWTEVDALAHLSTSSYEYDIPGSVLAIDLQQTGYEIEIEYWDTHGAKNRYTGKILWAD